MKKYTLLDRAMTKLVINHPFYATLALTMHLLPMPSAEIEKLTGGRTRLAGTNGTHLYIGSDEFDKLPIEQAVGLLQHEIEHVARGHHFRIGARDAESWNIATDAVINQSITKNGGALPPGGVDGTMFAGQTEEQIYNLLPKQNNSGGQGPGQSPPGKSHDHVMKAPDNSAAAQAQHKQQVAKAAAVAKAQGKLPGSMERLLDELLNPSVNWQEPLRRFLTELSMNDYSWKRLNRRWLTEDIYLPSMSGDGRAKKLGFLFDTSGSCFNEIEQYFGELCSAVEDCAPSELVVAYCDAKVQHADVFDSPTSAEVAAVRTVHGGGGTSMPAGLTWFQRNHPDVQAVIVLTDGETAWGKQDDYSFPVLWGVTGNATPAWGEHLRVKLGG